MRAGDPSRRLRRLMSDPRYRIASLAARAAWLELSLAADVLPELRTPVRAPQDADALGRLLGAHADVVRAIAAELERLGVLETISSGYRLKGY